MTKAKSFIKPEGREHKVRVRLTVLGATANDLAEFAGMLPQQMGTMIRSDHRSVKDTTLDKLAGFLGVDSDFLKDLDGWEGLFSPEPEGLKEVIEKRKQ